MTKYMYIWLDWGLYDIKKVEVVEKDYTGLKVDLKGVSRVRYLNEFETFLCANEHLFDTIKQAKEYAKANTPSGAF